MAQQRDHAQFLHERRVEGNFVEAIQNIARRPRCLPALPRIDLDHDGIMRVGLFAGLTAYDTRRIKGMYDGGDDAASAGRKAVMGALSLYLDFINLFMMMLRLMGNRR